jgi:hypothetical protein
VLPLFLGADDDGDCGGTEGACAGPPAGPGAEVPLGGIYFAVDTGCEFENLRDALLVGDWGTRVDAPSLRARRAPETICRRWHAG